MREKIQQILKKHWGYDRFRPLQEEIILSVLDGNDTLALLPTGGGKSVCFQVPALAMEGLCIVISPLIALMKDQVEHLRAKNIKAAAIYSGMSRYQIERALDNALFDKEYKFLYVSPERLKTDAFRLNFPKMKVSMIAVDEAHCISQWGYDFRPPYLEIAEIRPFFPSVPVIALTATATPEVVKDIQEKLHFKKEHLFQKSFFRENLTYYILKEEDKLAKMSRVITRYPGTGIVYVRNRRKTREIALFLQQQGITADFYHAGLDGETRDRKQNEWMSGKTRIIVATNAFGMGIDKPDVRFVIHLDIPDSLEAYFQEAGRGGRDGKRSIAVMLYDDHDFKELRRNFEQSFPELSDIKKIYHDISQFCSVPLGSGAGTAYPFDMDLFLKQYKVKPLLFQSALSFLEKAGVLFLSEQLKSPSTLHVKLTATDFEYFYKTYPLLEDVMKLLLRSYNGLFTGYVKINEDELARRMDTSSSEIIEKLHVLKKINAVDYLPRTDKPLLFFLENRVIENYLYFSPDIYKIRKKVALQRLEAVEHFVQSRHLCRSVLLLSYFGEKRNHACGSCDICRKKHRDRISEINYERIASAILSTMQTREINIKEAITLLSKEFEEEHLLQVTRDMIDRGLLDRY